MAPTVFIPAAVIILAFVVWVAAAPDNANEVISWVQENIVGTFGWYYVLLVSGFVVFILWVGLGHFGDIKLAPKDDEKPEFKLGSWFAMLFAAGMGIGLVFFGTAEPLNHFAGSPSVKPGFPTVAEGASPDQVAAVADERAQLSLVQSFLHWGLHPWAIYAVVGLSVAYVVHRKGRPVSIRYALEPILGDRVKGWLGDVIDIAAICGTLFGVATSLGIGVTQVAAGLEFLDVVSDPGNFLLVFLIGSITLIAVISVVTGVEKGIKWLSNINMIMAGALLLFVMLAGPALFIFREAVQSLGLYFQNLLRLSFDTSAMAADEGTSWQGSWTTFYWGWWISWAPFVGVFIARISRGRTVRQFVAGVLLVPTLVSFLWFTVFGGTALSRQLDRVNPFEGGFIGDDGSVDTESSLFGLLDGLPLGTLLVVVGIFLIVVFFVTSSDSGSFVVDMLASGGDPNPPIWSRVFWAVLEGAVAAALLVASGDTGLTALQTMAIIIALPFSIVMIGMCLAIYKDFHAERQAQLRIQRRLQRDELTAHVSKSLIEDGLIEGNGHTSETETADTVTAGSQRADD